MVLILFRIERHCTETLQHANEPSTQNKLVLGKIKNGMSFATSLFFSSVWEDLNQVMLNH
jgi:hypothetical protein